MKPKSKIFNYFKEKTENEKIILICEFCGQRYKNRNATRMKNHLKIHCNKCPDVIKATLGEQDVLRDVTNTSASTSSLTVRFSSANAKNESVSTEHIFNEVSVWFCTVFIPIERE